VFVKKRQKLRDIKTRFEEDKDKDKEGKTFGEEENTERESVLVSLLFGFVLLRAW
jgi:hypothetical protein